MITIVTTRLKTSTKNIKEVEFKSKKNAMEYIKNLYISPYECVFGNFKKTGKSFFVKYGKQHKTVAI